MEVRRRVRAWDPLSDSEFVGGFQRRAAAAAYDGGTITAGQRIVYLFGAVRAVEGAGAGFWRGVLGACRHEEENCSIEAGAASLLLRSSRLPIPRSTGSNDAKRE
jgi:hypothetical protein